MSGWPRIGDFEVSSELDFCLYFIFSYSYFKLPSTCVLLWIYLDIFGQWSMWLIHNGEMVMIY